MQELTCFKAYDVRGQVPSELNEDVAYRIGRAYADVVKPGKVVVGYDIRLTSPAIKAALANGLLDAGVNVDDIGLCGTEQIYHATFAGGYDGGIVVTASHNPKDYNGMKFVREGSRPISGDTGLFDIKALAETQDFSPVNDNRGTLTDVDMRAKYTEHLLSYINVARLKPLRVVVNAGNGGAGLALDLLEKHLPIEFIKVHHEPDGEFPNGVPNPLLEENRQPTIDAIKSHNADLGLAWDGDFDRCFFFDENARFIEGYYIVGMLADAFLSDGSKSKIVHDPRLTWNTIELTEQNGGQAVQSKTGHAFIKERMREEDAAYGGEMSAHHYFRDFAYCDSGMIPWLLVVEQLCVSGKRLSEMVNERMKAYPVSGEINRTIADPAALLAIVEEKYASNALTVEHVDGLSVEYAQWRFNLRMSNTEPVVRLNVETRGDQQLMEEKRDELLALMQ
ncbi:MAG: phosphomannomutase [Pseudomonadales bacterium]